MKLLTFNVAGGSWCHFSPSIDTTLSYYNSPYGGGNVIDFLLILKLMR